MTSEQLRQIIRQFEDTELPHFKRYQAYYEGQNPTILNKEIKPDPDNRKPIAIARKAINTTVGYMFMPGKIELDYEGGDNSVIDYLNSEAGQLKINQLATYTLVNGKEYPIVYQEDNTVKIAVTKPQNMIVIWNDKIEPEMEKVLYYTTKEDITGKGKKQVTKTVWIYEAGTYEQWQAIDNDQYALIEGPLTNPAKMLNVPEFIINPEKRNIFFHVIGLIDLMDELVSSNMANEIQTIANAILAMFGKYLEDEFPDPNTGLTERDKFLKADIKIIDGLVKANGDYIEWITKNVQWEGVFGIFDKILDLIFDLLEIPKLTDDTFNTQATGPAMAWKVFPFENKCAMIEAYFKQGLMKLIEIMGAFPASDNVDMDKVKITFKRNMPLDRDGKIEQAIKLATMIGKEYAIEYLGKDILPNMEEILEKVRADMEMEIVDLMNNQMQAEPQLTDDSQRQE